MALVEVVCAIIRELSEMPEHDESDAHSTAQNLKQINGLYDLLLERALDLSSYVRAKVLATLARLCESNSNAKFPQQRLNMTRAAVESLEDKASGVRKNAIILLRKLVLTHPYGMYGGFLSEKDWQEKYKDVSDMLQKMEGEIGKAVERDEEEDRQATDDEEGVKEEVEGAKKHS